jgi:hypothetical protein
VSLDALLKKLLSRCKRVPDLIADSVCGRVNPFPEWGTRMEFRRTNQSTSRDQHGSSVETKSGSL